MMRDRERKETAAGRSRREHLVGGKELSLRREPPEDLLFGRNTVLEALRSGRGMNRLLVAEGNREGQSAEIITLAKERGIPVQYVERTRLEALVGDVCHQGVLAQVAPVAYAAIEDLLERAENCGEPPFLILLDELEDPHNLGALMRTADAAGVHGILLPRRRSVPLNATVAKTSAGAVEYVPVARIGNVVQTMKSLKERGIWIAGADMEGSLDYYEADLTGPLALVVGSEGRGMSRLAKETCDFLVRIPMRGRINSLNASVAGAILMYEAMRQRMMKK